MRKSTRIVKRLLALFLVVLMSINTFAAVVGDNDGAAFITKAEFDSLKNDFQSQLDRYNSSIDNKIDGAIASYLSGISIRSQQQLKPLLTNYSDVHWTNGLFMKGVKRTYSDRTTYSDTSDVYQELPFGKWRNLRAQRAEWFVSRIYNLNTYHWKFHLGNYSSDINSVEGGYGILNSGEGHSNNSVNPLFIRLRQNEYNEFVFNRDYTTSAVNLVEYERAMADQATGACVTGNVPNERFCYGIQGGLAWKMGSEMETGTTTTFEAPGNAYLKFSQTWEIDITGAQYNPWSYDTGTYVVDSSNFNLGVVYQYGNINASISANAGAYDLPSGLPWIGSFRSQSTNQLISDTANFNNMLFGTDVDQIVNTVKQLDGASTGVGPSFDFSEAPLVTVTFPAAAVILLGSDYQGNRYFYGNSYIAGTGYSSTNFSVKLPTFLRATLSELKNNNFIFNNKCLELGQGMPLAHDINNAGTLHVSFDFTNNTADVSSSTTPDQKCRVSIKKSDFVNSVKNDYASTATISEIKNIQCNGGHADFDVEVKAEEDVWLRVGPTNLNPSGEYITLSNMKLILESE